MSRVQFNAPSRHDRPTTREALETSLALEKALDLIVRAEGAAAVTLRAAGGMHDLWMDDKMPTPEHIARLRKASNNLAAALAEFARPAIVPIPINTGEEDEPSSLSHGA